MQEMVKRTMEAVVRARLRDYPAVALTGPRQSGKTTLARALGGAYFDLEQETDRLRLDIEWTSISSGRILVVLDEAQAEPALFPRLRAAIDAAPAEAGRFLLLGSIAPSLMRQVSSPSRPPVARGVEPPAPGGAARHAAGPALADRGIPQRGHPPAPPIPRWQSDYLALLTQRTCRSGASRHRRGHAAAAPDVCGHARPDLERSQIGQSLGISYHTVESYMDYLEGAYLLRRLEPYQANLKKRLTKRPRLYWRDSGLLHAILGVTDSADLLSRPWVGASWEGYAIEQVLGTLRSRDMPATPFYFRTSDQHGGRPAPRLRNRLWAVEIKLTAHPTSADMARIEKAADLVKADRRILLTQTPQTASSGRSISCDLRWLLSHLEDLG